MYPMFKGMTSVEIADMGVSVWECELWLLQCQAVRCISEQRENPLGLKYDSRNHKRWNILALTKSKTKNLEVDVTEKGYTHSDTNTVILVISFIGTRLVFAILKAL